MRKFCQSDRWEKLSQQSINLHFSFYEWSWASFQMVEWQSCFLSFELSSFSVASWILFYSIFMFSFPLPYIFEKSVPYLRYKWQFFPPGYLSFHFACLIKFWSNLSVILFFKILVSFIVFDEKFFNLLGLPLRFGINTLQPIILNGNSHCFVFMFSEGGLRFTECFLLQSCSLSTDLI